MKFYLVKDDQNALQVFYSKNYIPEHTIENAKVLPEVNAERKPHNK